MEMSKDQKVPVSDRALIQRINRKLAPEQQMKVARGRAEMTLGRYYIVDRHGVTAWNCDLAEWGREVGVLAPHEELSED